MECDGTYLYVLRKPIGPEELCLDNPKFSERELHKAKQAKQNTNVLQ